MIGTEGGLSLSLEVTCFQKIGLRKHLGSCLMHFRGVIFEKRFAGKIHSNKRSQSLILGLVS